MKILMEIFFNLGNLTKLIDFILKSHYLVTLSNIIIDFIGNIREDKVELVKCCLLSTSCLFGQLEARRFIFKKLKESRIKNT